MYIYIAPDLTLMTNSENIVESFVLNQFSL